MWGNLTTLTDAINKQVNLGDIQERLGHVTEVGNRLNTLANSVFTFEEQDGKAQVHNDTSSPSGAFVADESGWVSDTVDTPRDQHQPMAAGPTTPNGSVAVDDEAALLRTQLMSVKHVAAQLSEELDAAKRALQEEKQQRSGAKKEVLDVRRQLHEAQKQLELLQQDIKDTTAAQHAEANREEEVEELKTKLTRAKKQLLHYKKQVADATQVSETAAAEIVTLQDQLEQHKKTAEDAVAGTDQAIAALQQQLEHCKTAAEVAVQDKDMQIAALQKQLEEYKTAAATQQNTEAAALQQQLQEYKAVVATHQDTQSQHDAEHNAQLAALQQQLAEHAHDADAARQELDLATQENTQLRVSLEAAQEAAAAAQEAAVQQVAAAHQAMQAAQEAAAQEAAAAAHDDAVPAGTTHPDSLETQQQQHTSAMAMSLAHELLTWQEHAASANTLTAEQVLDLSGLLREAMRGLAGRVEGMNNEDGEGANELVEKLEERCAQQEAQLAAAQQTNTLLTEQHATLEQQLDSLTRDAEDSKARAKAAQQLCVDLESKLQQAVQQLADTQAELEVVQAGSKAEAALAKSTLEDAQARMRAAEEALQQVQSNAAEDASRATSLQTAVAEANSRVAEAEAKVKEMTLRVAELDYKCSDLEAEAAAAAQRHELALKLAAEEAARVQQAAVAKAVEEGRAQGREEALHTTTSSTATIEATTRRYQAFTACLFAHLHLLARVVADAQDKLQHRVRLLTAMQDLEEKYDQARARLEVVTAELEVISGEAESLRAEAGERQKKFVAVQHAFKLRESSLQASIDELTSRLTHVESQVGDAVQQAQQATKEAEQAVQQCADAQQRLEEAQLAETVASQQINTLENRIADLQQQLADAAGSTPPTTSVEHHDGENIHPETSAPSNAELDATLTEALTELTAMREEVKAAQERAQAAENAKIELSLRLAELVDTRDNVSEFVVNGYHHQPISQGLVEQLQRRCEEAELAAAVNARRAAAAEAAAETLRSGTLSPARSSTGGLPQAATSQAPVNMLASAQSAIVRMGGGGGGGGGRAAVPEFLSGLIACAANPRAT